MNQQTYWISRRKGISLSAAFLLVLAVTTGCKKEANTLGAGVLNPEALLHSGGSDTFDLETYTDTTSDFYTSYPSYFVLGSYDDPKLGQFTASFYTELRPTGTIEFDNVLNLTVDSVVLSLGYKDYYGVLNEQSFSVQQVIEEMPADSAYYRYSAKTVSGTELVVPSSQNQVPKPSDSIMIGAVKQQAQLRLHLDPALGQSLIQAAYDGIYSTGDELEDYFKGIRVSVTDIGGNDGILYFYPTDATTRLTVYYTQDGVPNQVAYKIDGNCTRFNRVEINHLADVVSTYNNPSQVNERFYAQSFGTRAAVKLPTVDDIPHNSIVHDALLVLPIESQTLTPYYPSSVLRVGFYKIVDGDTISFSSTQIDYDYTKKRYVVDLRGYVQGVVTNNWENSGIYVYPNGSASTAERIIFSGPATTNKYKPKLIVKYTEY
jgi:hypothetical protein